MVSLREIADAHILNCKLVKIKACRYKYLLVNLALILSELLLSSLYERPDTKVSLITTSQNVQTNYPVHICVTQNSKF